MNDLRVTQFSRRKSSSTFSIERVFSDVRNAMPAHVIVRDVRNANFSKGAIPRLRDAWAARRHAGHVNHITGDVHYLSYFLPKRHTILTVHDTLFVERARGIKRLLLWFFWLWLPIRRCQLVTAISEESKRRVLQLVRTEPERIKVIPDPVSPTFNPCEPNRLTGAFRLLHVGTKPNKNLERIISALEGLDIELTIIGRLNDVQRQLLVKHRVSHRPLANLDEERLHSEYCRSDALIFVSLDEGFGLPILEAQATGRPVITSGKPPMDEVAGDGALFVNPKNVAEIRAGVEQLMHNAELRSTLVTSGYKNVEKYKAESIAAAYASLYQSVWIQAQ
ncbi:glycosyltransferase [Wenzhouxiangella sediminis]|nr:glycosyltransferase [Wenzhouxiangella sediminis]